MIVAVMCMRSSCLHFCVHSYSDAVLHMLCLGVLTYNAMLRLLSMAIRTYVLFLCQMFFMHWCFYMFTFILFSITACLTWRGALKIKCLLSLQRPDRKTLTGKEVCWLVGCSTSQQHASVSQGRICSDNGTCCHTEVEVADQTFHLTQSQYTTLGKPVPALTLQRQAPGRVATGVPIFESVV